jgi:hypothetical protein
MGILHLHPVGNDLHAEASPEHIEALEAKLAEKIATVHDGWGQKYRDRVHEKGKLTTWERIEQLKDDTSEVFEVGTLVNWGVTFRGSRRPAPGAGVVTAFVRIGDRWTVVIANDNTVASGAWWPKTPEKIERAQEMALRLRLPVSSTARVCFCRSRAAPSRVQQVQDTSSRRTRCWQTPVCRRLPPSSATASPVVATCPSSATAWL